MPATLRRREELDELLSRPTEAVIDRFGRGQGDVLVLGAGGKIGPSLARMAWRAIQAAGLPRKVFAVSRFSDGLIRQHLEAEGIHTCSTDLLQREALPQLPEASDILYLAGMKFGTSDGTARTWAMNAYLPALICERYPHSRIVAFSTGNVYGLSPVTHGGSQETDAPRPVGEYALSCLGRERIFEYFSQTNQTPVVLIRLNYACELRYGVLVDLALRIQADQPVPLDMGSFNVIWQGDSNAAALLAFDHAASPARVVNLSGSEHLRVRDVALQLAQKLGKHVQFTGVESTTALLSNTSRAREWFGPPQVSVAQMIDWVADWVAGGGESFGKPTHFEVRDGVF